jgi:5-methylthioadenosine/S-adenosylhomocysteine deaminase
MATINGARNLGWDKEIGSLEVGKKADIILFDLRRPEWVPISNIVQNLIWGASGDSVETVIIDGKIVMEDRVIKTFDEYEMLDKIQEIHEDHLRRLGKKPPVRWKMI